ncbi:MAG: sigma-54 dependent transcriptional regulator, partial [Bdellovibrio sp.]
MFKVLVVDDDAALRLSLRSILEAQSKFQVAEAVDGIDGLEKIESLEPDIVLLDVDMPRMNGLEALQKMKEVNPSLIVIMLTAYASIENAVVATKEGAYNFLAKPVGGELLVELIEKSLAAHRLVTNIALSGPILLENGKKFIGSTQQMQKVFNIIHRLSKVDTPVLIRGASGTGKELVARALHLNSNRKDGKFVAVNCSAIPENLFESELFGHEKGAFTGAEQRKLGKFQYAEGGTLFLDEVGDLPGLMQVKLLRVLQEKVFTPVGSNREVPTNVRVVAATNRPLEEMIQKGSFREDLFYRLNVIPVFLPSLVERKADLEHLIQFFIKKFNQSQNRKITGINKEALKALLRYDWPGNVRELENVIEHAFVMENSNQITLSALPEGVLTSLGIEMPVWLCNFSHCDIVHILFFFSIA